MALTTTQDIALVVMIIVVCAIVIVALKTWLPNLMRRRLSARTGETAYQNDKAYNAIQAGFALEKFLESEGITVSQASILLQRAEGKFEIKNYAEAISLAKQASEMMAERRRAAKKGPDPVAYKPTADLPLASPSSSSTPEKAPEPSPRVYRDLSRRAGEADPDTVPPPASAPVPDPRTARTSSVPIAPGDGDDSEVPPAQEGDDMPLQAAAKKLPKNFMEARFMLSALHNDLEAASPEKLATPEAKEAKEWATKSQSAFDRKDYDESLRLALRGRRRFGGPGLSTISVGPGTVVEAPPAEASSSAQRSSAPLEPTAPPAAAVCARCGRSNNPGDRFCRGCGAPMSQPKCPRCQKPTEPEDKFCHGCGAPLSVPT